MLRGSLKFSLRAWVKRRSRSLAARWKIANFPRKTDTFLIRARLYIIIDVCTQRDVRIQRRACAYFGAPRLIYVRSCVAHCCLLIECDKSIQRRLLLSLVFRGYYSTPIVRTATTGSPPTVFYVQVLVCTRVIDSPRLDLTNCYLSISHAYTHRYIYTCTMGA